VSEGSADLEGLRRKGLMLLRPCTRALMDVAGGGDPHLSQPSVVALGKIGDPVAKDVLAGLFDDDQLSKDAVTALNRVDDPAVVELLLEGSRSAPPKVMAACAEAFSPWVGRDPRVLERLEELCGNSFSPIRTAALRALGEGEGEKVKRLLLQGLADDDPDVVVVALTSLGKAGLTEEDLPALEDLFDRTQEPKVRATLADLFGRVPGKAGLNAAKKALRDPNPRVRANAVESIGSMEDIGDRRKIALLRPMIQEGENNRVLANIAIALGEGDPDTSDRGRPREPRPV